MKQIVDLAPLIKLHGDCQSLLLPNGDTAVIRQQNGDDDAILSSVVMTKNAMALNTFISSVTVWLSSAGDLRKIPTLEEIMSLPLGCKYFILISSRIFSIDPILRFTFQWGKQYDPVEYAEDLTAYVWDYEKEMPKRGDEDYFAERIPMLTTEPLSLTISQGRQVRYKFMDSYGEKYLLELPDNARNINQKILAHNLEMQVEGEWVKVTSFKSFTPKDMAAIRSHIEKHDPEFVGLTTLESPYDSNQVEEISIIQVQDFFFPREI